MGRARLSDRGERLGRPHEPAPRRLLGPADAVTAVRVPLAAAFPFAPDWHWQFAIVVVAGLSDVLDGVIARRFGSSRLGVALDPIADKAFMISAFVTLVGTQMHEGLEIWELAILLLRDLAATGAFLASLALRRPFTVPARLSGKVVTIGQFLVLAALVVDPIWLRPWLRPMVWATGLAGVWAIIDYYRVGTVAMAQKYGRNSPPRTASE